MRLKTSWKPLVQCLHTPLSQLTVLMMSYYTPLHRRQSLSPTAADKTDECLYTENPAGTA